jgi:hypothetical protein
MTIKKLKTERILLWAATEYQSGYEFPIWLKGKWVNSGQWKLEAFIS